MKRLPKRLQKKGHVPAAKPPTLIRMLVMTMTMMMMMKAAAVYVLHKVRDVLESIPSSSAR